MATAHGNTDEDVVDCRYSGASGAGETDPTWAQRFMWDVIAAAHGEPAAFDFLIVRELPEPIAVPAAVDVVRRFILRHPVLRGAISVTPAGVPTQRVHASATVAVAVSSSVDPASAHLREAVPGTTATELCRPLLVLRDERVVCIAMRISHLATDGSGVRLLSDDLVATPITGDAGSAPFPAPTPSPVDLAAFERSAKGQAIEAKAIAFAEAIYATCPPTMWPRSRRRPEPTRFWYGELRSADLLAAMEVLIHQKRHRRVGILAGALGAVAASAAGLDSALLYTISNNRFDPAWSGYPGQLSQEAILHLPIRATLDDTIRTATVKAMRSLQAARYAPAVMRATCETAERARGVRVDKLGSALVLNLLAGEPHVRARALERTPTTFAWTGTTDKENLGFFLDAYDAGAEFVLAARVDTALMAPAEAEAWLRTVEWALVSCAAVEVPTAELPGHLAGQHLGR